MAKHRGPGEPDDAFAEAVLRAEADRYAPDAARIRSRIDAGLARGADAVPSRLRLVPPLAVAGAVAATLVGVVVLVERAPDTSPPSVTSAVVAGSTSTQAPLSPSTTARSLTPSPSSSSSSSAPRSQSRSSSTSGSTPATTTRPVTGTTPAPPAAGTRAVATSVASLPTQVSLPATGGEVRDWVVVGARNDGKVVRQKNGTGLIAAPEVVSGTATPSDAPVDVIWSGGIPEQDRTVNGTWWTAPSGPTVFRVRLGAVDRPSRVTLYLGADGTTVQVRASVDGLTGTGSAASVNSGAKAAVTIELDQAAVGHTVTIEVGAGNSTTNGTISLAAVALR